MNCHSEKSVELRYDREHCFVPAHSHPLEKGGSEPRSKASPCHAPFICPPRPRRMQPIKKKEGGRKMIRKQTARAMVVGLSVFRTEVIK
jgi:hypothetical protein